MKKVIALVFALFVVTAAVAEGEENSFKFELDDDYGDMDQTIDAGLTIHPIGFVYEGITSWEVTGLPHGLFSAIDEVIQLKHRTMLSKAATLTQMTKRTSSEKDLA